MKDKDAILLESVYTLILEGKREENIKQLDKFFGENVNEAVKKQIINAIINTTTGPPKGDGIPAHALQLGKFIYNILKTVNNVDPIKVTKEILNYYKVYLKFRRQRGVLDILNIKNFDDFKKILDNKQDDVVIKQNILKTDTDIKKVKELLDETNTPYNYYALAKIIESLKGEESASEKKKNVSDLYLNYVNLKQKVALITIDTYKHFEIYTIKRIFQQTEMKYKDVKDPKKCKDTPYLINYYHEAFEQGEDLTEVVNNYKRYIVIEKGDENNPGMEIEPLSELTDYIKFKEYVHLNYRLKPGEEVKSQIGGFSLEDKVLYEDDKIKVWAPHSASESIQMGEKSGQVAWVTSGNGAKWCTTYVKGVDGMANQYNVYKSLPQYHSTFYYVLFKKYAENKSNPVWFSCIQSNNTDIGNAGNQYMFTSARNDNPPNVSWSEMLRWASDKNYDISALKEFDKSKIVKFKPELYYALNVPAQKNEYDKLKNDPVEYDKFTNLNKYEDVFKHIKLDADAIKKINAFQRLMQNFSEQDYNNLKDDEKEEYLQLGYPIYPQMWDILPRESKIEYLSAGALMDKEIHAKLNTAEKGKWRANRLSKLTLAISDVHQTNPELNEFDFEIMADPKNNLIDKIIESKKQRIIEAFLDYYSKHNPDLESNPTIFRLVLASPNRCKNAILKKIDSGKKLEEIDPRYMEGVLTDNKETEELMDKLTEHGTNFGDVPPVLYNLIIGSPLHSSKYLLHQLQIDQTPISEIDAKLINKAFENIGTQQKVFNILKTTGQIKDLYLHPDVDESIKEWIHYYDPKEYIKLKSETKAKEVKEKPEKGKKKVKKEEPKVDEENDGDLDFGD